MPWILWVVVLPPIADQLFFSMWKKYHHFIDPVACALFPANMCPSNKCKGEHLPGIACTRFSQQSAKKEIGPNSFPLTCKTRYVEENSSDFQFLVYCWKCNRKSQPQISHGRLRASGGKRKGAREILNLNTKYIRTNVNVEFFWSWFASGHLRFLSWVAF